MITVNGLMSARHDELTLVAGAGGADRLITWAHVCDLPDPWSWVRPGDLLMTTGDGLPAEPDAQRAWMVELAAVGISGVVLAPRPEVPPPSASLMAVADERRIPLVLADFSLQFTGLARTVIEAAVQSERDHINTARRLFDVYTEALRTRPDLSGRLDVVARSIGWSITVTRSADGVPIATGGRVRETRTAPVTVPVPGRIPVDVHVQPVRTRMLDGSLAHYLAGLIGIELEHQAQAELDRQRRGELVLRGSLDGSVNGAQLRAELATRGMNDLVTLAHLSPVTAPDGRRPTAEVLAMDGPVAPLLAYLDDTLIAVVPTGWDDFAVFRQKLAPAAQVGLSAPVVAGGDLRDARLQARAAAAEALHTGARAVRYEDMGAAGAAGPRSLVEMRSMVTRVLGPLLENDRQTGSALVRSLEVFLRNDSSWTRSATALGVHRQTLVYRLNQVERLTGLKPTSTAAVAELWTAFEAAHASGVLPTT
jgi:purine catabolism regulator